MTRHWLSAGTLRRAAIWLWAIAGAGILARFVSEVSGAAGAIGQVITWMTAVACLLLVVAAEGSRYMERASVAQAAARELERESSQDPSSSPASPPTRTHPTA